MSTAAPVLMLFVALLALHSASGLVFLPRLRATQCLPRGQAEVCQTTGYRSPLVASPRPGWCRDLRLWLEADTAGLATSVILGLGGIGAAVNFAAYAKLQVETAQLVGGIPRDSVVTEIDAQDGKNVFYLPPGIDYTAVMASQSKEKAAINEQLILESVGKANGMLASATTGGGIKGKLRTKTQEIRPKTQDVVLSVGAIGRATDKAIIVNEALRMLKPGGLFVFLEPGGDDVLDLVKKFFPERIEIIEVVEDAGSSGKKKRGKAAEGAAGTERNVKTVPGISSSPIEVPFRSFISGIARRP